MAKENRVDGLDIIKEIAKSANRTYNDIRDVLNAYQKIIQRELQAGNPVTIKAFGSFSAEYRKFSLISASGNPVTGGIVIKFNASRPMREIINSKDPVTYDIRPASDNQDIINKLRNENRKLKLSNYHAKRTVEITKQKCEDRIKKIYENRAKKRVQALSKVIKKNRIKREVLHKVKEKLVVNRVRTTHYLDAITAYPVLTNFYKSQGLTINELNMFILVNHFKNFKLTDSKIFGIKNNTASNAISVLVDAGLVERFEIKGRYSSYYYAPSLTGKKKFTEFAKTINKGFRALLREYEKVADDYIESLPIKSKL